MNGVTELDPLIKALSSVVEPALLIDNERTLHLANAAMLRALNWEGDAPEDLTTIWPDGRLVDLRTESLSANLLKFDKQEVTLTFAVRRISPQLLLLLATVSGANQGEIASKLHQHRLEMLGLLSGGIAHDINNILTGILGHASYLMATLPQTGNHGESLRAIEDGAKKAALMTRQIVNFSRQSSEHETVIDLTKLIESACNLLRGAISKEYTLSFEVPARPVYVSGIEGQLTQVLVNLVVNARDALASNGEISIVLREQTLGGDVKSFTGLAREGLVGVRCAEICVADNGQGIPDHLLQQMWQPYFSTKRGKGSGIGLATVRSIVDGLAGAIDVRSKLGVGTSVSVFIPIANVRVIEQASDGGVGREIQRGNQERILVVDDEASVRQVLSLSLERLGYQVEVAASGDEALAKFVEHPQGYDLVVLDMIMPDMSGREVFVRLQEYRSDVRVLISSAFSSDDAIRIIMNRGGKGVIRKPYDIEELARRVKECLEG